MSHFCPTETMASVRHMLAKWCPVYERAYGGQPERRIRFGEVKPRLSKADREAIIARLRKKESPKAIGRDYKRNETTIRYYLKFL